MTEINNIIKCPCEKCILICLCRNKGLNILLGECKLLQEYIIEKHTHRVCLDRERLYKFCNVMGINVVKNNHSFRLEYGRNVRQ
jgi:hypothetical protein